MTTYRVSAIGYFEGKEFQMAIEPLLRAKDGAKLYGHIKETDEGEFYASCRIARDTGDLVREQPDVGSGLFKSLAEARSFLSHFAAQHGFKTYQWVSGSL